MKILIVAFYDDNFGDMLIRTCFVQLMKVVLDNLGIDSTDYTVDTMELKYPDKEKIREANLVIFPGGGLFGLSYLGFLDYVETVVSEAELNNIPVIFSSLGVNNMSVNEDISQEYRLYRLLEKKCIKAISARDGIEVIKKYDGGSHDIIEVCDPVVWAKYVYSKDLKEKNNSARIIGLNVVRGGLFKSNGIAWNAKKEEKYLLNAIDLIKQMGFDYRLFTNGQFLDSHELYYFSDKHDIPTEKVIIPDTSREVVKAINDVNCVLGIRMHSSIISYGLGIPSINLGWNLKVYDFYNHIHKCGRVFSVEEWNNEMLSKMIPELLNDHEYSIDRDYLMTLYGFLYRTFNLLFDRNLSEEKCFAFEMIEKQLLDMSVPTSEDDTDLRIKIRNGTKAFDRLYIRDLQKKKEIKKLKGQ